jgi:hypothetical protein
MEKTIAWLITSSKDPRALSLTVKGLLVAIAPLAMYALGLTEADFNDLVGGIVNLVFTVATAFSAFMTVWGLLRKVRLNRWSALK